MTRVDTAMLSPATHRRRIRVLDLFAGLRGWSDPWKERGHETFTVDNDPRFGSDLTADVMTLRPSDLPWRPDVVLASPPCEGFSVLRIGYNWTRDHEPKTDHARLALALVTATVLLIRELDPTFFVIENPRAKLRKLPIVADLDRRTVTYCQYGDHVMKPTDLWGRFPPSWVAKPTCVPGAPCHDPAPRQSTYAKRGQKWWEVPKGTTGKKTAAERALIPRDLSLSICEAAERDLSAGYVPATLWETAA